MFLERLFSNAFGTILLIVFMLAILLLLIWFLIKKERVIQEPFDKVKKDLIKEVYKGFVIAENDVGKFEIEKSNEKFNKVFDNLDDCKIFIDVIILRNDNNSNYEIIEVEGFFKVRKKGSERTIRKFNTQEEAEDYIKEKENND